MVAMKGVEGWGMEGKGLECKWEDGKELEEKGGNLGGGGGDACESAQQRVGSSILPCKHFICSELGLPMASETAQR